MHPVASSANSSDHLLTLEEISHLVAGTGNPAETLANIVGLVQMRFQSDVCSLYFLDTSRTFLVLAVVSILWQAYSEYRATRRPAAGNLLKMGEE